MNTYKLYLYNSTSYSRVFWSRFFLFCLLFLCGAVKVCRAFSDESPDVSLSPVFLFLIFSFSSLFLSLILLFVYYFTWDYYYYYYYYYYIYYYYYYCRNLSHFFYVVLRVFHSSSSSLLLFANDHGATKRLPRSRIDERFEIDRAAQSGERVLVAVLVVHAGDIHLDARVFRR